MTPLAPAKPHVVLEEVTISYPQKGGGTKTVLDGINLSIEDGEFVTIVGASGCGKSTIFRLILGSQFPNSGMVTVGERLVERVEGDRGIVFQKYSLFPHHTVVENIEWGLIQRDSTLPVRAYDHLVATRLGELAGFLSWVVALFVFALQFLFPGMTARFGRSVDTEITWVKPGHWFQRTAEYVRRLLLPPSFKRVIDSARKEAMEFITHIGLTESDADKFPGELSGGMRQRVAIAQAVIMKPTVLLMDEPFGALDPPTREDMQLFILEQWQEHGLTVLFVTHDTSEACFLGSRVIVLGKQSDREGAIVVKDAASPRGLQPLDLSWQETAQFGEYTMGVNAAMRNPEQRAHAREFQAKH